MKTQYSAGRKQPRKEAEKHRSMKSPWITIGSPFRAGYLPSDTWASQKRPEFNFSIKKTIWNGKCCDRVEKWIFCRAQSFLNSGYSMKNFGNSLPNRFYKAVMTVRVGEVTMFSPVTLLSIILQNKVFDVAEPLI